MKYTDAINYAVSDEMKKNKNIIIMGQDIRWWGGASGALKGLYKKFGNRVIDTPISEAGTTNIAIGAAMTGLRPIIEFTFFDFILCAMDPIINQAAKIKTFSNSDFSVPIVVRSVISSHRGYGGTHSQNLEHMFMYPGLNVVYPSNPHDAAGLMRSALHSDKPTIFLEHKLLHQTDGEVTEEFVHIGKAEIKKSGKKLTVITYGRLVPVVLDLVKNMDIEVVDLRSLQPLDTDSIIYAANKTGKLLIIEDGHGFVSSRVESLVHEKTKCKVERLHAKEFVIPAAKELEDYILVTEEKILEKLKELYK